MKERAKSIDSAIGRNIRAAREKQRMSQQALGDAIGVSFQQIQKYESAKNRVAASTLVMISEILTVRLEELIGDDHA